MEKARILHVEDSPELRDCVEGLLCARGLHRVVAWADSVAHAQEQLVAIYEKRLDANVVLLDGHLRGGAHMNHARVVINYIKELELDLPVVGLSGEGLACRGITVGKDIVADLMKDELCVDTNSLGRILDELPEPAEK